MSDTSTNTPGQIAARDRIIVALDCNGDDARRFADLLRGHARWLKVGMTLYYSEGPAIVSEFKKLGFNIFVDLKLYDIPHQVEGAAANIVRSGADFLTVHASGGADMMKAAASGIATAASETANDAKGLAVTVVTSMDDNDLEDLGIVRPMHAQVLSLAKLAQASGMSGVISSPAEAEDLRKILGPDAPIVTPGIRPAGIGKDDQSRVSTPKSAIAQGASHLVIGRPITESADPVKAFEDIVKEIEN
ncbi:MAG: orotidine-5'-phosphate decarboxylase [Coriobacteriales bacterium]|nr:orotidine-5'-phosphate decarboxylase [Coriobacteriales bacterium]